jgi:dimethylhistidine N-methyltransferase
MTFDDQAAGTSVRTSGGSRTHAASAVRREPGVFSAAVADMALHGLTRSRKSLPPSLFYDETGCDLFYQITKLPEYYLTRTEFGVLERAAPAVADGLPAGAMLVEYGASDETKAAMLLCEGRFRTYIPIDVATPALRAMRDRLAARWPALMVTPLAADFTQPITLPERDGETAVMGFFPGSTIGNLEPDPATAFLRRARETLGGDATFLLGFDTCRDPDRLIPAYDDPAGVTARFNLNLLSRLNREAGATFDRDAFAHRALWNAAESRIEMHLVAREAMTVLVAGRPIRFARGETIHTENSYKYPPERMAAMTEAAGWSVRRSWTDPDGLFAIWHLG